MYCLQKVFFPYEYCEYTHEGTHWGKGLIDVLSAKSLFTSSQVENAHEYTLGIKGFLRVLKKLSKLSSISLGIFQGLQQGLGSRGPKFSVKDIKMFLSNI